MGKYVLFPDAKGEPRLCNAATVAGFANPAAGANFSFAIPAGGPAVGPVEFWRPLTFEFDLVTSAGAGNRYIRFNIGEAKFIFSTASTASQNWRIRAQNTWPYRMATGAVSGWNYAEFSLPEVYLNVGQTLATDIIGILAADQISNVRAQVLVYRDRGV